MQQTKGQIEATITERLTRFEREFLGRGPEKARSTILGDQIVVRLTGILSQAEKKLCLEPAGIESLKMMRSKLIEQSGREIKALVAEACGMSLISMHTDISTRTGERIFVFTLESDLEERLQS